MAKIKVTRDGAEVEIEESEKLDGDVLVTSQEKKGITFSEEQQTHINKLLADERRKEQSKYNTLKTEYDSYKGEIETERTKHEEKLKVKVDEMKKGLPEPISKLLEKLSVTEQMEFLEDPENKIEKPVLPNNPKEKGDGKPVQKIGIIF